MEYNFTAEEIIKELDRRARYQKIDNYFPDKGPVRRSLYKKHLLFFKMGASHRQRLFQASNRAGKSTTAAYEIVLHLTGVYPHWWKGKRFSEPTSWWVCGKTKETVKQILQPLFLGDVKDWGTGLIPRHLLDLETMTDAKRANTPITAFKVKHISGGFSSVEFKSYDQGRNAFEGTTRSIWCDEEVPQDVYGECLLRTMIGDNIFLMTWTPLQGLTEVIMNFTEGNFTEGSKGEGKYLVNCTWDDVPHLDEKTKKELYASIPEYQRDARTKGIPSLGAGAVYPILESEIVIPPFQIPEHYRLVFGLDYGWSAPTAIIWAAVDPNTNIVYLYAESYVKQQTPLYHCNIIKSRNKLSGFDIPGVCDPSGGGRSQADGTTVIDEYRNQHDVILIKANNSIEPGIMKVLEMMQTGQLKVFSTLQNWIQEFRLYRRNENGKLVGEEHILDATRYVIMSGLSLAISKTEVTEKQEEVYYRDYPIETHWEDR